MTPLHGMALFLLSSAYLLRADTSTARATGHGLVTEANLSRSFLVRDGKRRAEGTYFENNTPRNVTAVVGQSAVLLCSVKNLGNHTVSWIRGRDLHVLTSMTSTYTSDARFRVIGRPEVTGQWNLRIDYVQPRDAGIYECQVNSEPKIHMAVHLKVLVVQARIWGAEDVYVKRGSTISLTCTVDAQDVPPSNVTWYHNGAIIDFDGPRGGVSLETEKTKNCTTSKLLITRALPSDSGNYTCESSKATPTSVTVHVLNGEHPAAMQRGGAGKPTGRITLFVLVVLMEKLLRRTIIGSP
ncbi:zwei Ig domain protein zig-8 [Orussus abietinus]|uniref:zwei Ig domain protein zig-8 n=1 Tax=Orussus abietinus TaxID=222816 RepID=UPI0006267219|nr:zwei Ig domain protein zig-8 [Orussus abietinus]